MIYFHTNPLMFNTNVYIFSAIIHFRCSDKHIFCPIVPYICMKKIKSRSVDWIRCGRVCVCVCVCVCVLYYTHWNMRDARLTHINFIWESLQQHLLWKTETQRPALQPAKIKVLKLWPQYITTVQQNVLFKVLILLLLLIRHYNFIF